MIKTNYYFWTNVLPQKNSLIISIIVGLSNINVRGQNEAELNCFTILVGKNASSYGSIFVAHNEDDLSDHNFVAYI